MEHTETCDICDETTTCVKNQSPLTATRKRERERAWAPVLCSCQRHGGSSTTRRKAPQRDQQPRNHGSRGKSPGGGEAATREGQVWGTPVWRNACLFLSRLVTIVCCIMRNEISILAMLLRFFFTYTKMMIIPIWKNGFKNITGILLILILKVHFHWITHVFF